MKGNKPRVPFGRLLFAVSLLSVMQLFSGCGNHDDSAAEIELPLAVGRQDTEEIDLPCETIEVADID